MFNKKNESMSGSVGAETVIAEGVKVEGNFTSEGNIVIDGDLSGAIETAQALQIGASAKIVAEVKAKTAVIAGRVEGNVFVTESLDLLASSSITGDISAKTISVAPGAKINGRVSMQEAAQGVGSVAKKGERMKEFQEEPALG